VTIVAERSPQPTTQRRLALIAVCLGFAVIQLDATIVNVALPTVQHDLGGNVAGLQWVINGYTVALAVVLLTAGALADLYGARRTFLCGLVVFCVGSAACAAAPDIGALIAARVLQGLGAAALLPSSLALIVHQFPERAARAKALGAWGGIGSLGLASGPILGGLVVQYADWRIIFIVNIPAGVLTWWLVVRTVGEAPRRRGERIDVAGLMLGILALAGLVAGFIEAGQHGWTDHETLALLAAGVSAGTALVVVERRTAAPMIPPGLFGSRAFSAATGVGLLFNLCLYGTLLCLSLYLQQSRHVAVLRTGLVLLPMTVMVGLGAMCSGRLTARFGPRRPMIAGMACGAAGAGLLAMVGRQSPIGLVLAGSMLLGLCSLAMPAMTATAVGAVSPARAGLASGVLNAARQSGGAFGVAILGSLFAATGHSLHASLFVVVGGYLAGAALSWLATR